jgi:tungstate transport system ATP-binding protein
MTLTGTLSDTLAATAAMDGGRAAEDAGRGILPLVLDGVCYEAGGKRLVDAVSLTLSEGPLTMVLGANGAGKSLLLRLCHGLLRPTQGTVRWGDGAPVHETVGIRRAQAMVFQAPVLLRRSVLGNVTYALAVRGVRRGDRKRIALDALSRVGLEVRAALPARVLSGGEKQRLALARAWALDPQVLFLDEPTANLDPAATRSVEDAIDRIRRDGTKIVMTTHDMGQARRLADEVIFLHHGRVLERASRAGFFDQPQSPEARAFLKGDLLW